MKTSGRRFPCLPVATVLIAAAARGGTVIDLLADPNGWSTWAQRSEVAPKFELQEPADKGCQNLALRRYPAWTPRGSVVERTGLPAAGRQCAAPGPHSKRGAAGGVMNLRTKSANPARNTHEVELKIGDDSTRRGTIDINRSLIKNKLALRVMGLLETRGHPMPHMYTDKESATIAGRYRLKPETTLSVSFERTRTEGVRGRPWHPSDSLTGFLRQLEAEQVVWAPSQERYETLTCLPHRWDFDFTCKLPPPRRSINSRWL